MAVNAAQRGVLLQAGEALSRWLLGERITAEDLARRLDAGEALLARALSDIPQAEVERFRGVIVPALRDLPEDSYILVLKQLETHVELRPHARLLYDRYYWTHFVPALESARRWFVDGAPL